MQTVNREAQPRSWKSVLYGTLTTLLLLPVPVYATYSLGLWQVAQPSGLGWGVSGTGSTVTITPAAGSIDNGATIDFTAPVNFTSTTHNVSITTTHFDSISGITSFGTGLTITIGFLDSTGALQTPVIYTNQFSSGTVNQPLLPTPGSVTVNNQSKMAIVRFAFDAGTAWGVSSSPVQPITVTFTPGS
jgi:hypothetical protein